MFIFLLGQIIKALFKSNHLQIKAYLQHSLKLHLAKMIFT